VGNVSLAPDNTAKPRTDNSNLTTQTFMRFFADKRTGGEDAIIFSVDRPLKIETAAFASYVKAGNVAMFGDSSNGWFYTVSFTPAGNNVLNADGHYTNFFERKTLHVTLTRNNDGTIANVVVTAGTLGHGGCDAASSSGVGFSGDPFGGTVVAFANGHSAAFDTGGSTTDAPHLVVGVGGGGGGGGVVVVGGVPPITGGGPNPNGNPITITNANGTTTNNTYDWSGTVPPGDFNGDTGAGFVVDQSMGNGFEVAGVGSVATGGAVDPHFR